MSNTQETEKNSESLSLSQTAGMFGAFFIDSGIEEALRGLESPKETDPS